MYGYVAKRIAHTLMVLFCITFLVSLGMHIIPADAAKILLGDEYTDEAYHAWRERMGLHEPFWLQYVRFVQRIFRGDLGTSFKTQAPVAAHIRVALPQTIRLGIAALIVAVVLGVPSGIVSAVKRNTIVDKIVMSCSVAGVSAPSFWIGLLLLYVFAFQLRWFPIFGASEGIKSLVLPSVTMGINYASVIARVSRANMLEVLHEEYVRTARAKGLAERRVIYKHALKNAAIPIVTLIGLQMSFLITGSVIVETVFAWPGMGRFLVEAVQYRDIPGVQAAVLIFALVICLVNLAVDLLYVVLNPRVRYGDS